MRKGRLNNRERSQILRTRDILNEMIVQREKIGLDSDNDEATNFACNAVVAINEYLFLTRGE